MRHRTHVHIVTKCWPIFRVQQLS